MEIVNFMQFPDEVLLEIFQHSNNIDLLNVAKVCTRFERITKELVAKNYNGDSEQKFYEINLFCGESTIQPLQRDFLETFSNQITALNILVESFDASSFDNLVKLISQHCCFAKHVNVRGDGSRFPVATLMQTLSSLSSLSLNNLYYEDLKWPNYHFPQLERFDLEDIVEIDAEILKPFLRINPQIKHFSLCGDSEFPLDILQSLKDDLNGLKSLEWSPYMPFDELTVEWSDIRMNNLESLKIKIYATFTSTVLGAIGRGSKMIRSLEVEKYGDDINVDNTLIQFRNIIGLFGGLTSLKLVGFEVGMELIEVLTRNLPNLITLHLDDVQLDEITTYKVLQVFTKCTNLKELKLESDEHHINPEAEFNLQFHRKLTNITRNRGSNIKLELIQEERHIIISEDKIIENGELLYWTGYEAALSPSNIHLFDLRYEVLEKMHEYLDDQALHALYENCTEDRIKLQWITISDENSARDLLSRFGDHIRKLDIDMKTDDRTQMAETWKLIGEKCSDRLTEMKINNVRVDATGEEVVKFPNLSKIRVRSMVSSDANVFPLMECPKLTQLQFDIGNITLPEEKDCEKFGISTGNLTTIRVFNFDEGTQEALSLLDQDCCNQMKEFTADQTLEETLEYAEYIFDTAMRFRNLVTLNLVCVGESATNVELLFQSCSKLRKLTLGNELHEYEYWQEMIQYIKENCKDLEVIQVMQTTFEYDLDYLEEITNAFPTVEVKTVVRDNGRNCFVVETLEEPELVRRTPF